MAELDVSVTISQELRDIVARRRQPFRHNVRTGPAQPQHSVSDTRQSPIGTAGWKSVTLRRDAARPLRFKGMALLGFCGTLRIADFVCQHSVRIYVSAQRGIFLALDVVFPTEASARPLFRAIALDPAELTNEVAQWCDDIAATAQQLSPTSTCTITPREVHDAFNAMTLHCFRFQQFSQ